jgi:hypothetical protein
MILACFGAKNRRKPGVNTVNGAVHAASHSFYQPHTGRDFPIFGGFGTVEVSQGCSRVGGVPRRVCPACGPLAYPFPESFMAEDRPRMTAAWPVFEPF